MKLDLAELNNIDFNDVGKWPIPVKVVAILMLCAVVLFAGYWFDTQGQLETLDEVRAKEEELKNIFRQKQGLASNLASYKDQMEEMQRSFGAMLRQLPSETEVAELLIDISQAGLSNGLEFELFRPEEEVPADFYAELPIKLRVTGKYHEFGLFVSDVASLPRIVTLHDFSIERRARREGESQGKLVMEAIAKTYRYLDEEEQLAQQEKEAEQ
ncbi:MAG: type 4a pilus biogenesis protein PilO [Gammaproteobacteria bacterium]